MICTWPTRTWCPGRSLPISVARVGLTEEQVGELWGKAIRIARLPFYSIIRAEIEGETEGMIKLVLAPPSAGGTATKGSTAAPHDAVVKEAAGARSLQAAIPLRNSPTISWAHTSWAPRRGTCYPKLVLAVHTDVPVGRIAQTLHVYPTLGMGLYQVVRAASSATRIQARS